MDAHWKEQILEDPRLALPGSSSLERGEAISVPLLGSIEGGPRFPAVIALYTNWAG